MGEDTRYPAYQCVCTCRPEDNPTEDGKGEGEKHLGGFAEGGEEFCLGGAVANYPRMVFVCSGQGDGGDGVAVAAVLAEEYQWQKQESVVGSPSDERPVGTVPEARQQEDNERIANDDGFPVRLFVAYAVGYGGAAATQGDIDVIAEPCGERDMPTPPKLRYVATEIRYVEVAHQFDTEQLGCAYGYVGVAREVAVNLNGKQHGCEQECAARVSGIVSENGIHVGGTIVRHDNLFEQSPEDLAHAVHRLRIVEMPLLQELRQEIGGAFDRSGNELGKERQECGKGNYVMRGLYLTAVNVYGIGKGLEGVETDTHRQNQVQEQAVGLAAKEFGKGTDKEIVVLVCAEDSEIEQYVQPKPKARVGD